MAKSRTKKSRILSVTASCNLYYRYIFTTSGLNSTTTAIDDETTLHCWTPKLHDPSKPTLVLIHGFGANAMWHWTGILRPLQSQFNLYIPDLVFFGDSHSTRSDRSESFQAQCLMRLMMEVYGVKKMSLVGLSYGGFVAYSMAVQFKDVVERLVLICAGVCLEEKDLKEGLFKVGNCGDAIGILVPQTPEKVRDLMRISFVKPFTAVPDYFLHDYIQVMCTDGVQEKKELIEAVLNDRKLSDLPKISQPTLILWGEHDQVFPLELGFRLKRHIGENAEVVVIKNAGHAVNMEKPNELYKNIKSFLVDSVPCSSMINGDVGRWYFKTGPENYVYFLFLVFILSPLFLSVLEILGRSILFF